MKGQQLTLGLQLKDDATFENFYPGDNSAVLSHLHAFLSPQCIESFIYLWGPPSVGRTHLLQACCHANVDQGNIYLDLSDHSLAPSVLIDLEYLSLVCLDNIDAVMGDSAWEEALFHFYNRLQTEKASLLVTALVSPNYLACQLADLKSRLSAGLILQLLPMNDEQKLSALKMRAQCRGLDLPTDVGQFLINHYPREMSTLFAALETLDQASMVAKHRLTIPFLKQVLEL